MKRMVATILLVALASCSDTTGPTGSSGGGPLPCAPGTLTTDTSAPVTVFDVTVVREYPHNDSAFTQGLIWVDSALVESTGKGTFFLTTSWLRRVDLETGSVIQARLSHEPTVFSEGVAQFGNEIFQLSWTEQKCFVYDATTLAHKRTLTYTTDGWGLTHDGTRFIMSDGTSTLYFRDPQTFAITGQVTVTDNGNPRGFLNELEYIGGLVYANVLGIDTILIIDPANGRVGGRIDASGLAALAGIPTPHGSRVLNGIAWDADGCRLFVTGKLWPKLFEIKLVKQ